MLDKQLVLHHRNSFSQGMKIFYLEESKSDGTTLIKYLSELITLSLPKEGELWGVLPYRLGILYESVEGHVTPLLIEYYMQVDQTDIKKITIPPRFRIYSTDSRSFDVEGGEHLRQVILNLPLVHDLVEVYALGLDPAKDMEKKNTIRQHSDGVCGAYSLLDLELMLRAPSLSLLFGPHIIQLTKAPHLPIENNKTFQITKLPPNMMMYTQSINGDDANHRKGLRHYIKDNPDKANICFTLADRTMSFADMISKDGYLSILSGLSQTESPLDLIQRAVASGEGNATFHVGDKKITLQALYNWHDNQEKNRSKQKAFMMDYFVAVFNELIDKSSNVDSEDLKHDDANLLLQDGVLKEFALEGNELGPMTELVDDLTSVDKGSDVVPIDDSKAQLFDSIVTQLAREVIARTPHREQLLAQDREAAFVLSPSSNAPSPSLKKVSPDERQSTTPPIAPFTTLGIFSPGSEPSTSSFRFHEFCLFKDPESPANKVEISTIRPQAKHYSERSHALDFLKSNHSSESESESDAEANIDNAEAHKCKERTSPPTPR